MKKVFAFAFMLALPMCAWATSTAYLRPTSESAPSTFYSGCKTGSLDTNYPLEGAFGSAHTGKSGAGPTGSSAAATVAQSDNGSEDYDQDVFGYTWQSAPSGTLSSATLYISINDAVTSSASGHAYYTTNSGSSWASLGSVSTSQATLSVSISSLSGLGILICGQSSTGGTSAVTLTVYDVWVAWTYTPTSSTSAHAYIF
jgi:hypothetical protein